MRWPRRTVHGVIDEATLERETTAVGGRLYEALPAPTRNPLKVLDDRAMDLASPDAELKAALFRFVDVVPACRSLDDLARHLTGFLGEVEKRPPPIGVAMRMGNSKAGRRRSAPPRPRASSTWRTASSSARTRRPRSASCATCGRTASRRSVDLLGEATVTQAEAQRYADRCADALDTIVGRVACVAGAPAARARQRRRAPAREPLGEGVRADAAAAARRARARQARRRRPAAPAAAPRARARRAPAHRHGVDGLARRGARADPRAAGRGRVPRRAVAPGWCCRATCATRRRRSTRSSSGSTAPARARAAADDPAGQGRLLGPRARRGRASTAGPRRCSRSRPTPTRNFELLTRRLLDARPARPRRDRLAQPALGRHAIAYNRLTGGADTRPRAAGPARPRRPAAGRDRRARACACAPTARSATSSPGMAYLVRRLLENTSNESFLYEQARGVRWRSCSRAPLASPAAPPA